MNDLMEKAKGYKLIGLMVAFIILTLLNGSSNGVDGSGLIGDLTVADIEKALLAGAVIAGKSFLNRTFGKGDGVSVKVES